MSVITQTLITSGGVEFFILSRIVIFDMSLTLCITLALYSFYEAAHADKTMRRRIYWVLMYGGLAVGTLIKGLVGLLIPGLINSAHCLSYTWCIIVSGARFSVVSSGRGTKRAGFLRYYLWDEHFGRFATTIFDREQPWYFFLGVVVVGFLPGVCCFRALLNATGRNRWMAEEFFCYHGAAYR